MSAEDPQMLVRHAENLMTQGRRPDAEILLIEAWRLAQEAGDDAMCGDIAFRIAATYRLGGHFNRAREFDIEAVRFQRNAFGLS
ncbi:MAG: hypothetical protein PVJ49_14520 [Acidobacteriota bacterium]|jgi:hypothetical protein